MRGEENVCVCVTHTHTHHTHTHTHTHYTHTHTHTHTATIQTCIQAVKQKGFPNYFGLQRFGTGDVPTYVIGKCLLLKRYDQAIALLLAPRFYLLLVCVSHAHTLTCITHIRTHITHTQPTQY